MNGPRQDEPLVPTLSPSVRRILMAAEEIRSEPLAVELAFMARALVQATLPHSEPGEVPVWGRTNGRLTLTIKPDWELDPQTQKPRCVGVPYGTIPRLLLFWITTEAVQTKSRRLELGESLSAFMRELGLTPTGGRWGTIPRLREQMTRLFRAKISFEVNHDDGQQQGKTWMDMQVAPKGELWWNHHQPEQGSLWKSWIELGDSFYEAIVAAPVPVDLRALRALKKSPMALDLYAWMNYRTFTLQNKQFIPWRALMQQLGSDYGDLDNFRKKVKAAIRKVLAVSPGLNVEFADGGMILAPGRAAVAPQGRRKKLSTESRG
jgi:Plasmid encoded RepA protein